MNMSFRLVPNSFLVAFRRRGFVFRPLSSDSTNCQEVVLLSTIFSQKPFPSRVRPMHSSSALRQTWALGLRLEGVQGPLSTLPSLKESKRILEHALKEANAGFSQQGVQGGLHTHQTDQRRAGHRETATADWEMEEAACPQGVQGDPERAEGDCSYFATWLENCRRYGLADCDQQLQGIQSGRLTLAQVLADQEARIAEIADRYRKRAQELSQVEDESLQGAQGELTLPALDSPCPQGVQGDDCVRFKLWLENCHRFGLHECLEQLQGLQAGRLSLAQVFTQQDALIRQVVEQYQQKRN